MQNLVLASVGVSLGLLAAFPSTSHADVAITSCGTVVPNGNVGTLSADLDCSAFPSTAISLGAAAALDLAGFQLIGNPSATAANGVTCAASCTVRGPGTIRDFSQDGIHAEGTATLHQATLSNNAGSGIRAKQITVVDSIIEGSGLHPIYATASASLTNSILRNNSGSALADNRPTDGALKGTLTADNCTFTDNSGGIFAVVKATVRSSTFERNGSTVHAHSVTVQSSRFEDNGRAPDACGLGERPRVSISDSVLRNNDSGICAIWYDHNFNPSGSTKIRDSEVSGGDDQGINTFAAKIERSDVSGHGGHGVEASRIVVSESTVSNNGGDGLRAWSSYASSRFERSFIARVVANEVSVSGNTASGIRSEDNLRVTGSGVSGNSLSAPCNVEPGVYCADLVSGRKPGVVETTCDTSLDVDTATDWDVCALDQ